MADLRRKFFDELKGNLAKEGIVVLIKENDPLNGLTIKLNGVALYKIIVGSNPYKDRGVAIFRNLNDATIVKLGGKKSAGKNKWVAAPLTEDNYKEMMQVLLTVSKQANEVRNFKIKKAGKELKKENAVKEKKVKLKPKKKIRKQKKGDINDIPEEVKS